MKAELNWVSGPPTKPGKCLLAIRGSEDAIPAVVSGETGKIWSWTSPAVKYDPDSIVYHAAWLVFPRERDERWIECDRPLPTLGTETIQIFRSEPIGEETADEYPDRLVKEATPAWEGVDPEKFLAEVRGRAPFDEAITLLRQLADLQNGPPLEAYREEWEKVMSDVHEFLKTHNA
jgi:hypothetical protein